MKLETKRLRLREYTEGEREDFLELMTDREVMKFVEVLNEDEALKLWEKIHRDFYKRDLKTILAVFEKNEGRFVGHAVLRPRPEKKEEWEVGFILKKNAWGKGLATEISGELIKLGFEKLGLREVFATVDDDNLASINVLKKSGMSFKRFEFDDEGRFSVYSVKKKKI